MNNVINKPIRIVTFLPIIIMLSVLSACDLFNNEKKVFNEYGLEDGFFYWSGNEKIELSRYKGHVSIKFKDNITIEEHDKILRRYGIETVHRQFFNLDISFPGFYRVTEAPAKHYYTNQNSSQTIDLVKDKSIEYILPAYALSDIDNSLDIYLLTPYLLYTFADSINISDKANLIDSLEIVDGVLNVERSSSSSTSFYSLYLPKEIKINAYDLYHRYYDEDIFMIIDIDFAVIQR